MRAGARRPALAFATTGAALTVPLLVALFVLRAPRWYPLLDWAQTEIRVRDVASTHPPLIGLAGRIGPFGADGGSHPGPLSFYALWPVWKIAGGTSWGLVAGTVVLDAAAIAIALWIARRRGGLAGMVAIGAVLAVLLRAYGAFMLTSPWNPYLPVLWWFVFLLSVWSLLDGDLPMAPVAALAGSFCAQTHIPYLGLVGGLGLLAVAGAIRARPRPAPTGDGTRPPAGRWRWAAAAAVLVAIVWAPPLVDELVHDPGNLTTIREHFSDPPEPPIGARAGIESLATQLNPLRLFGDELVRDGRPRPVDGSRVPGALLVAALAASAAVAVRLRHRVLVRLHVVLGAALVLGAISAARIFGKVWFYLLLWAWVLAALGSFAVGWTAVEWARSRLAPAARARAVRAGGAIGAAVIVAFVTASTVSAARVDVMSPRLNAQLAALAAPTVDALHEIRRGGDDGPYLVTWLPEPQAIGAEGYGLLNELLRAGFDAVAPVVFRPGATRYHVVDPARASLQVHLATGRDIECWRRAPGVREVAAHDPRSADERAEFESLREQVRDDLGRAGLDALVREVDENLFMLALAPGVPEPTRARMSRMLALGFPAAVFVGPEGDPPRAAGCG